ncbi:MAG TPA: exosortase-associated EpsI family protein [Phycisphaerales bacterium]|nr:exosortase-associated EpsI family protein [Phycisphaerales bacterium]
MYPVRHNHRTVGQARCWLAHGAAGGTPTWFVWLLVVLLLISAGAAYRTLAFRLERVAASITLPVSLDAFPRRIGRWVGEDVPIPLNIQEVAGNDAFVNRLYKSRSSKEWVNVYIAYTAHPRTMRGHRPRICYVAGGWIHDGTEQSQFTSSLGRELSCLIHRFHRPAPSHEETVVLNFYIVNGRLTCDDRVFSGVGWRTPNIEGDPARYVTQVQISSVLENSARAAAKDMAELVFDFFPDENGKVKAVEYVEPLTGQQE